MFIFKKIHWYWKRLLGIVEPLSPENKSALDSFISINNTHSDDSKPERPRRISRRKLRRRNSKQKTTTKVKGGTYRG